MNTKKFFFVLFAISSISYVAQAQVYDASGTTVSDGARAAFTKYYNTCSYSDQDGNYRAPKIVQIPKVECGALGSSKTPQGLCDDYVRCQGTGASGTLVDAVFHVRCYSYDGQSCGDPKSCRDADGMNVYQQMSSGNGYNSVDQKARTGTSK